jgi:hypothetical protein
MAGVREIAMKDEHYFRELDRQWTQYGDYAPENSGDIEPPRAKRTCKGNEPCDGCKRCLPATE